jgi:hypothetical protein
MNTTWLVATGLRRHGFDELADKLEDDLLILAHRSGLWEYFNPVAGTGHGTYGFSWSAAIVLHILCSRRTRDLGDGHPLARGRTVDSPSSRQELE